MPDSVRAACPQWAAAFLAGALIAASASAQVPQKALPDPYAPGVDHWAKLPDSRPWGGASALSLDPKGNVWVFERCGGNTCAGRPEDPILAFDASGKFLKSFGAGMFVFPHGLFVDDRGNVWVADADGKEGKGHTVVKFSPDGKVLMTLGKPGVAGSGPDTFNRPSGVAVAPNGDIFVSDGHGGDSNARIVKFSKDGTFIKAWGMKGTGVGEFNGLHGLALDSQERVFVADRENARIQIFDRDGKFIDQWNQFSRPSGIYIDKKDVIYVADDTSGPSRPDWPRGVRIGSAKDGSVTAFIPDADSDPKHVGTGPEAVAADANGNVYTAEVVRKMVKKFPKP